MQIQTKYFEQASRELTMEVLEVIRAFIDQNSDIHHVVIATTEGSTGVLFAEEFESRAVVVTHHTGFRQPNLNEIDPEKKKKIEEAGAAVLTATHAFAGMRSQK